MAADFRTVVGVKGERVGGRNHRARLVCLITPSMIDVHEVNSTTGDSVGVKDGYAQHFPET